MNTTLGALSAAAVSIGFVHTVLGPDHYVPFVAMARAGRWTLRKTMIVTLLCGIGHVGSSAILGLVGVAMGAAVFKLEALEAVRGDVAGWLLVGFGLVYFVWGLVRLSRGQAHSHLHAHEDGTIHAHGHSHEGAHLHVHAGPDDSRGAGVTPWVLFTIFLLGPCEPLIPLVMYPAASGSAAGVVWVTALFGAVTLATMAAVVYAGYLGLSASGAGRASRYGHAVAGLVILACGIAVNNGL